MDEIRYCDCTACECDREVTDINEDTCTMCQDDIHYGH